MASIGEPRLHQEYRNIEGCRRYHRAVILRTNGPISKSELARLAQLQLPVVSEIVDDLVGERLIEGSYPTMKNRVWQTIRWRVNP